MLAGRMTSAAVHFLDWAAAKLNSQPERGPRHLQTGRRGEEAAYFYLRRQGYVMVARNFRSPRRRGEIDLIGWDKKILCFIEVKTRTTRDVKPAEAAVDRDKWRELTAVAGEYLRHLPPACDWRFDLVSVYYDVPSGQSLLELFKNAYPVA